MQSDKECLNKLIRLWIYLAKNPSKTKKQAYKELELESDFQGCPLCEQCKNESPGIETPQCENCLLADYWPLLKRDMTDHKKKYPCMVEGSSFLIWWDSRTDKVRTKVSWEIALAALNKLHKIGGEFIN